jgi:hypothetical protein
MARIPKTVKSRLAGLAILAEAHRVFGGGPVPPADFGIVD